MQVEFILDSFKVENLKLEITVYLDKFYRTKYVYTKTYEIYGVEPMVLWHTPGAYWSDNEEKSEMLNELVSNDDLLNDIDIALAKGMHRKFEELRQKINEGVI